MTKPVWLVFFYLCILYICLFLITSCSITVKSIRSMLSPLGGSSVCTVYTEQNHKKINSHSKNTCQMIGIFLSYVFQPIEYFSFDFILCRNLFLFNSIFILSFFTPNLINYINIQLQFQSIHYYYAECEHSEIKTVVYCVCIRMSLPE